MTNLNLLGKIITLEKTIKKIIFLFVLVFFVMCPHGFAAVFVVDGDLNVVSPIYYQNIIPPYFTAPLNTGLFLNSGDLLEIAASGFWGNASYLTFGPNGNPNENIAPIYPGAGYPVAALLGKLGNNGYFFIGSNYSNHVSESGILYLGFNDTDYGNNWGTVNADVEISPLAAPVPEPSSLLLLGLGGLLMGNSILIRRRK